MLRPTRNSSFVRATPITSMKRSQARVAVDQAELRRRHPELGAVGADPQVAAHRELEPAAEAVAVDRGDDRERVAR